MPGHGQNGRNWAINAVCRVDDDALGVHGNYLIVGRTFALDRDKGATTEIKRSKLGDLPI